MWSRVGRRNHALDVGPDPLGKGRFWRGILGHVQTSTYTQHTQRCSLGDSSDVVSRCHRRVQPIMSGGAKPPILGQG